MSTKTIPLKRQRPTSVGSPISQQEIADFPVYPKITQKARPRTILLSEEQARALAKRDALWEKEWAEQEERKAVNKLYWATQRNK